MCFRLVLKQLRVRMAVRTPQEVPSVSYPTSSLKTRMFSSGVVLTLVITTACCYRSPLLVLHNKQVHQTLDFGVKLLALRRIITSLRVSLIYLQLKEKINQPIWKPKDLKAA